MIAFSRAFCEFLSGFLAAFLLGFQQVFCRLFCRYFADFDMKNEEIWQLLRKSDGVITCLINGLVMRDRKCYNMHLHSHLK